MKSLSIKIFSAVTVFLFIFSSISLAATAGIQNPLRGGNSISEFITSIMGYIVRIGGIIAIFAFIWAGFKYVMAQGDPGKLKEAKEIFIGTVIGVAVLLGAQLIASIVIGTLKSLS